jgi:hypothetical protein
MSSSRVRAALLVGSVCIFILFLLLPGAGPSPVKAAWVPRIVGAIPKDPGTPFEEPEFGDPGNNQGRPAGSASGTDSAQPELSAKSASENVEIVVWQVALPRLVLILWHLQ